MVSDPVYLPFVTSKGADPHDDDENMEATRMKVLKPILYQLVHVIKIESNTCMLQRTYMYMYANLPITTCTLANSENLDID